jgi:hypothetical protein
MELPGDIKIKEESWVAKLAAKRLKANQVAIVFGKTIYLYGVAPEIFLQNEPWVKHELKHVAQYRQFGFVPFIFLYLAEWIKKGYYNNRFEVEAREAEQS